MARLILAFCHKHTRGGNAGSQTLSVSLWLDGQTTVKLLRRSLKKLAGLLLSLHSAGGVELAQFSWNHSKGFLREDKKSTC